MHGGIRDTLHSRNNILEQGGGDNYANCDGAYVLTDKTLHGMPVYENLPKGRFLGWSSHSWVITSMSYQADILSSQPAGYGGYHSSPNKLDGWTQYTVVVTGRDDCSGVACAACEAGTFKAATGAGECSACPAGTSSGEGATECSS